MKRIIMVMALFVCAASTTFATTIIPVTANEGIMGYAGGCFPGTGACMEINWGSANVNLKYDEGTGALWMEVESSSSFYNNLAGGTFEFESDSYLTAEIVDELGWGSSSAYISAATYTVSQDASGTRTVQLSYVIE